MINGSVLAPDLISVRGYRAPEYPQSSSSLIGLLAPIRRLFEARFSWSEQTFDQELPVWVEPTIERIVELVDLQPGWDSYDAKPPTIENVTMALQILSAVMSEGAQEPWIGPLPGGGIELDWQQPSGDIEIAVEGADSALFIGEQEIASEEWAQGLNRVRALLAAD